MPKASDSNKRIAKNTIFLYFRMILIMAVNLYTSRIVLNTLGVVDYGVNNVVGGIVTMFSFINTALAQATQRYIAFGIKKNSINEQQQIFSMLLNVHIMIAILVILLSESVGLWFLYHKLVIPIERIDAAFWVMQCSILSAAISITQVPYNASIFGHERMNIYAYISIFEGILKLLAVISLVYYFNDKLIAYAVLLLIISITVAFSYRLYCIQKLKNCKYVLYWSKMLFKEIIGYTSWSLIGNLAWTLNGQGMNILVNLFFGPVYNAARGIAVSVETAVTSFLYNFTGAAIPQIIIKYAAGDMDGMKKLSFESSKLGFLLFMCLSLPLISIINKILEVWLSTPPPISNTLCVLSLIYIQCNSMSGTLHNVIQATGDVRNFQISNGTLKLIALPIVYLLYRCGAPVFSYLLTLIFISIIGMFVQLVVVNRQLQFYKISHYLRYVVLRELSSYILPFLLAIELSSHTFSLGLSIFIFVGMMTITIISAWTLGLNTKEREWIYKTIMSGVKNKFRKFEII